MKPLIFYVKLNQYSCILFFHILNVKNLYYFSATSYSLFESQKSNNDMENRMLAAERRLVHMASLLSESEAENTRLNELANVLKEEIRKDQRSEERSKHIENLEYVKNVIFKVSLMYSTHNVAHWVDLLHKGPD